MTITCSEQDHASQSNAKHQAHFCIYENLAYVGDQRFEKEEISIGRSPEADVVLNHATVANIHALVHFEAGQAFLTNRYPENGLRLNGRPVDLQSLQNEDIIDIGPFSLKVRMAEIETARTSMRTLTYAVRLVNRYPSVSAMQQASKRLADMLGKDPAKVLPLFQKEQYIIKKHLDGPAANRWQNALRNARILFDVQIEIPEPFQAPEQILIRPQPAVNLEAANATGEAEAVLSQEEWSDAGASPVMLEDEPEEDEEIWEAPFSLGDKLSPDVTPASDAAPFQHRLQVIKTIGNSVVDAEILKKGKKYRYDMDSGHHCLVHHHPRHGARVYVTDQQSGYVKNSRGETVADLNSYKTDDYQHKKNRSLFCIPLPADGTVVVMASGCQYRIFEAQSRPSPNVTVASAPVSFTWRHWAGSAGFHLLFILSISISLLFQTGVPKKQAPHFIKIDPAMLKPLVSAKAPKPPKKALPPAKPEPRKATAAAKPSNKKSQPVAKSSKRKPATKRVVKAAPPSKHSQAGGGVGAGNIKNRNINQAGLLGALGGAPAGSTTATIAAATNLDAVKVPGASEKNFTVGGLKGSLGNGKIAVATGDMVQTKGSAQVLRSAGASGKGDVAALEKGTTGKKQVQAMVTASMSRTVKIEGGMSREMVKRVIDQHLDEITYCYETALIANPSISGRIVFEWKILMDGRVGAIRIVSSNVNSHDIHDCIQSAIKTWRFPKPKGAEVVVSYPFVFDLVAF